MKRKRTPWTKAQMDDFNTWHEGVIAQYPEEVRKELRWARLKFVARIPIAA